MMITSNHNQVSTLDQLTKRSVRSFWMDGLWDLVIAGMLLIIAMWGLFYIKFVAFPSWTWPFFNDAGQSVVWFGLLLLVLGLTVYVWIMWVVVKKIKERIVYPYTGYADHRFLLPMDPKVFGWYAILYITGLGLLYGLFYLIKGGFNVMSIPFIISPAAILVGVGWFYGIRRYLWIAGSGFILALLLEFLIITQADYMAGPRNFLDTLPQWGSPTLPCLVWTGLFMISGVIGLINIRSRVREAKPAV
jgi:hypothetical protein